MVRTGPACRAAVALVALLHLGTGAPDVPAPYPAPGPLPPLSAATLDARYGATQRAVADALALAEAHGDLARAAALRSLRGRQLLEVDARGTGRAVEVIGDLVAADRIAVLVPGSHTTLDSFGGRRGPGGAARALADQIRALDPYARVAVVAWLGYRTPQGLSYQVVTDHLARAGAERLRETLAGLAAVNPHAPVGLLCHSYGSVVCAYAVSGPAPAAVAVSDLALYGSPGVGVEDVRRLSGAGIRVWVGRAARDWIRFIPAVRLGTVGFGTDPMSPEFGGRVFPTGTGGHGDYHLPGSTALHSLALIALGTGAGTGSSGGREGSGRG